MIHNKRVFNIVPATAEKLIEDLQRCRSWTLCSGWRVGDTLFLNDSFSEDGALELAVLRVEPNGETFQIESITIWSSDESIARMVNEIIKTKSEDCMFWAGPLAIRLDHGDTPCDLCR